MAWGRARNVQAGGRQGCTNHCTQAEPTCIFPCLHNTQLSAGLGTIEKFILIVCHQVCGQLNVNPASPQIEPLLNGHNTFRQQGAPQSWQLKVGWASGADPGALGD